jgi:predicted permease
MVSAAAGLMLKSFVRARNIDPGFDPTHVLSFRLIAPDYRYARAQRVQDVQRQVMDRIARLPGVTSVSAASHLPMVGGWHIAFTPEGTTLAQTPLGTNNVVFPGFFETLKMSLVEGRSFTDADKVGTPPVAIVNETLARRFWGRPDVALGKRIKWGSAQSHLEWKTIVGVVRDVKETSLDEETQPGIHMAALQQDSMLVNGALRNIAVIVRTRGEPMALAGAVRRAVREVDPELPIAELTDASTAAFSTVASRRFGVLLLAGFATLGLLLTAVGIYGQMAYSVTQRQREIGVRLAIGATPAGVLRLVVGQGVRMALIGIAVGVAGALALAQLLQRLLFGVSPLDVPTFALAVATLLSVCVAATWLPAWRASRVDPALAMRAD